MNTTSPLEAAKAAAIAKLVALPVPRLSPFATADEIMAVHDFLFGLAEAVDPLIATFGQEFVSCAPGGHGIKQALPMFQNQLREALVGNALYELQSAADIAEAEYEMAAE